MLESVGVPLEQQTTTHRKDGTVTPCVSYGTVADIHIWAGQI